MAESNNDYLKRWFYAQTLQLIRSCNHIVSTDESKEMIRTVRRSSDTDYDILIRNNTVLEIISVTQVDENNNLSTKCRLYPLHA